MVERPEESEMFPQDPEESCDDEVSTPARDDAPADSSRDVSSEEGASTPENTPEILRSPMHPRNWLDEKYPLVDADFVGSTLDRVLHDRLQIESEASRVDEIQVDSESFAELRVPEPSSDFVETTLRRIMAQRAADHCIRSDEDFDLHVLLDIPGVPDPKPEFVDATLRAVIAARHETPVATEEGASDVVSSGPGASGGMATADSHADNVIHGGFGRRFSVVASVAAIVLCAVAVYWTKDTFTIGPDPVVSSPVSWASLITIESPETPHETSKKLVVPLRLGHPAARFVRLAKEGAR